MFMCECDTLLNPQKDTLDNLLTPERYVAPRRHSPNFQLSRLLLSVAVTYVQSVPEFIRLRA
jgi:hypothetical protein